MGLFQNNTIVFELSRLTYKQGEELQGVLSFDFGEEEVRADKFTVSLIRQTGSSQLTYGNKIGKSSVGGKIGYSSSRSSSYICQESLLGSGIYRKESVPFHFMIPENIMPKTLSIDLLLEKLPEKYRDIAKKAYDFLLIILKPQPKRTFKIEARMHIPWGKDIVSFKTIKIT